LVVLTDPLLDFFPKNIFPLKFVISKIIKFMMKA